METKPTIKFSYEKKLVPSYEDLQTIVKGYRAQNKTIVVTSGVYDMIHDGHVKYMEIAKSFGDVLILGLNDDERTRNEKGKDRPFDNLEARVAVLGCLSSIDHIKVRDAFEAEDAFIKAVQPDVLVVSKSSTQYVEGTTETFPELMTRLYLHTGIAKRLEVLDPQSSNSTTAKMGELMKRGMTGLAEELLEVVERRLGIPLHEIKKEKKEEKK